jgi:hypothetical protein
MAVIGEDHLDSAFGEALDGIAANTAASSGDDSDVGTDSQLTERTKKMNSENIKKVTNQAIQKLITALNEGQAKN